MNGTASRFLGLGVSLSGLVCLGWVLTGQAAKPSEQGLPTDWSHTRVIFTHPATTDQERVISQDPRYWQQRYRREVPRDFPVERFKTASDAGAQSLSKSKSPGGFWSEDMGANGIPGNGNYPAKYSFSLTTANCASATKPDYVVYSTGLLGSGTQASIVAFDNIYSGCTGPVPTIYWAYNTGGLILTSPVISLDGTQIAFVQTSGSPTGNAGLVLLKWAASATERISSPGVPTSVSAALYPTCVAPCMTEVFLHNGTGGNVDDRTSSPYYDYSGDIAWVGGAGGWLHKITGAFKGTPTEVSTGGFPAQVNGGNALSNPLYDHASQNVFVGDLGAGGGFLYRVASANGTHVASGQLDLGVGVVESPVLDVTSGLVYVFASSDGTTNCAGAACSAVYVLSTAFGAGTKGSNVTVGNSGAGPNPMYPGAFDSAYYSSVNTTGSLYVCGNTGANPTIYRIPISAGVMGAPVPGAVLVSIGFKPACSPIIDFPNPNASVNKGELLYFSVQNRGRACGGKGCLMNFVDQPWQPLTHYNAGQELLVLRTADNTAYIQVAVNSGTSGSTAPAWPAIVGKQTLDGGVGGVTWLNQGATTITALNGWVANRTYGLQARIFDGTNVEITVQAGKTGGTVPVWNTTIGGKTTDGAAIWINAGPWPSADITVTGGTGGMIIDGTSTSAGASQVYFFTQGNQLCTTSTGTGVCAIQASQANLQ